ncbi:class I adenylate-forming enzyme family protein [[Mycobacterium] wendilense]|uniref:Class I adenylate-forming enzyme family protein n=1 Tax=[Mycobacterium] wendilense TaxID=3064284 RepID=A0ABM9MIJ8_9MYCO|nr:class I adenylate-forming enzyme family protein [Mycolicibacterium sp. MU0050]CAJ1586035.1 class I adenylate-forming enzyme family protein [Mycolicibacterium sp. MU0050]
MTWTTEGSIAALLRWRLDEKPERGFAYVEDEGPWTYQSIGAEAVRVARGLRAQAVGAGDLVIVRLGNDERFLAAVGGVWMGGAGAIVMHPAAPSRDVTSVATSMGAKAIIADPEDLPARSVGLPCIAIARFPASGAVDAAQLAQTYSVPAVPGSSPALVLLTSGTTGQPKGVVLTHDNAWANLRATVAAFRSDTSPTPISDIARPPNLISNPLSHTAGVVRLLFALYVGRTIALLRKFDATMAKSLIDRHGIDNLTINPAMMRMLLENLPDNADLGKVRYVSSGTAPLPPALREEFEKRFGVPVLQAYGQTEAFGGIAIESVKDVLSGRRKPGSVGRPLPGVELRIVGPDGEEVAGGEVGEIVVRARSATSGYIGGDAVQPVDDEGWLRTGDQGRVDEDGYLFITGRIKNIIICGGFNIVPEEVEAALAEDRSVREVTVVGVPDDRLGEVPVAIAESDCSAADLIEKIGDRLAPYKRPRRVFVVDALPRVANGKVDRPAAAALARELCSSN